GGGGEGLGGGGRGAGGKGPDPPGRAGARRPRRAGDERRPASPRARLTRRRRRRGGEPQTRCVSSSWKTSGKSRASFVRAWRKRGTRSRWRTTEKAPSN